jgi:hypothetical protein
VIFHFIFVKLLHQIEEDIGSAEEQPTSNRFDTYTKNEGSLSALFYTFFGMANG